MIDKIKEVAHKLGLEKFYGLEQQTVHRIERGLDKYRIAVFIDNGQPDKYYHRRELNIYQLIFDKEIGFIEALVGDKVMCNDDYECIQECVKEDCHSEWETCPERCEDFADHHRQRLATMTLDGMIEYINKI
jgi:hypothetical protein